MVGGRGAPAGALALYTVIYPAALRFVRAWYRSVAQQTDRNVDLWISVDGVTVDQVVEAIGEPVRAVWRIAPEGITKAMVRTTAISEICTAYPAVVFVDSDDLLLPERVAEARRALAEVDLAACSLEIMDEAERALSITFAPPENVDAVALLPRYNIFGLSNTAYRASLLLECLPIAPEAELMDWLLATRAWGRGARLRFDRKPQMRYRQYAANTAPVLPPFTADQVLQAARLVRRHYAAVLGDSAKFQPGIRDAMAEASDRAEVFWAAMSSGERLAAYVQALNRQSPWYVWWWCVAHPELEELWRS